MRGSAPVECWLITTRLEIRRLEFESPPDELCLPDRPLTEMDDDAPLASIQDAPYVIYKRYDLPDESPRLGIVYSVNPPTVGDIQILSAFRAGDESRPKLF